MYYVYVLLALATDWRHIIYSPLLEFNTFSTHFG